MLRVTVPLAERSYEVVVGAGAIVELDALLPDDATRVAIVTQEAVPLTWSSASRSVETYVIDSGESAKSLTTIETLLRGFARQGLTRRDVVIGLGGGMVTDVAGFAAASWHRGTSVVHVATTLLGMVDAAIGGKTGVNLPEGKNLVGAFWQPLGVICDLDALSTLPEREMRCGLGEMSKYHFLTGDDLLSLPLDERIARCVEIKAGAVAADEREGGRRALLNYGHTLAHAIEIATDHEIAHGEAVAIGLVFAAELAHELDRVDEARVDEHRRIVAGEYGLRITPPEGLDVEHLLVLMARDKKAVDGLTFVLDGPDGVEVVAGVPESAVRSALSRFVSRS
ncbi:MAG TPA: 3-dehydroquinate synthase family protein [Ilumatobacteraceae bacterium]|nr:3-dehydroquinate synthase family protein [Ilumatobacteraceae bacterium]